ncbi:GNAT family N-acetyltransferase [Streptomyces sp. NBC_01020]|uniref:GNAT family N-acetyltransferase n=1 Tax=unclassified Streptomyces TaxID=2593676 RepID=UPI002E2407A9|nr:GNAT family N-acetyltransferase [Streptomyces sp. NBC_01020]WSX69496.1 GNAT family N-acetyltransferase [Streptomyces sp. NBC_00932]
MMTEGIRLRPVELSDAEALATVLNRNREHMRPWDPARPESFYTADGQLERLRVSLADRDAGRAMPWVLEETGTGNIVGSITLNSIIMGPLCSGVVGYWVDAGWTGRGVASGAVEEVCRIARDELGLHRVEAGTVLDNVASQRVLVKCGFETYGVVPRYLHINGEWRDHRLFQRILHDRN